MAHLPFKTDRLSTMGEDELISLADEIEHDTNFWHGEEIIQKTVDRYIQDYWRQPHRSAFGSFHYPLSQSPLYSIPEPQPYITSTVYKDIRINVPDAINEREARLFAEIQIREQLDPTFDPTED